MVCVFAWWRVLLIGLGSTRPNRAVRVCRYIRLVPTTVDMTFNPTRDRLKKWPDLASAIAAPIIAIGGATLLGLGPVPVALGVANIATIFFASLAVVGVLFDKWRSDIELRGHARLEELRASSEARADERAIRETVAGPNPSDQSRAVKFWQTVSALIHPSTATAGAPSMTGSNAHETSDEVAEKQEHLEKLQIEETLAHNRGLRAWVDALAYIALILAALSGGFSVAGEIRQMEPLCVLNCAPSPTQSAG